MYLHPPCQQEICVPLSCLALNQAEYRFRQTRRSGRFFCNSCPFQRGKVPGSSTKLWVYLKVIWTFSQRVNIKMTKYGSHKSHTTQYLKIQGGSLGRRRDRVQIRVMLLMRIESEMWIELWIHTRSLRWIIDITACFLMNLRYFKDRNPSLFVPNNKHP